jgi:OmpA-OmpF porin, OOP family
MMLRYRRVLTAGLVVLALTMSAVASAQAPSGTPPTTTATSATVPSSPAAAAKSELPRFLVYFNEFSAYMSPRSKEIVAKAAKEAKASGAKSITVQARASATGTVQTNKYLAMTRASIVADELQADGIPAAMVQQDPIGQTGSGDPSVFNRRVDIILHR